MKKFFFDANAPRVQSELDMKQFSDVSIICIIAVYPHQAVLLGALETDCSLPVVQTKFSQTLHEAHTLHGVMGWVLSARIFCAIHAREMLTLTSILTIVVPDVRDVNDACLSICPSIHHVPESVVSPSDTLFCRPVCDIPKRETWNCNA